MNNHEKRPKQKRNMGFKKSVLIDAYELDRLKQRQLREYNPVMSTLGKLQDEIFEILNRKDLDPQAKLSLIAIAQSKFNTLKNEIGGVPAMEPSAPTPLPEEHKTATTVPENSAAEEVTVPRHSALPSEEYLPVKVRKLLSEFQKRPNIISANEKGELVLHGQPVPGTKLQDLVKSLFHKYRASNAPPSVPGEVEFFTGLRALDIKPSLISSKVMRDRFGGKPPIVVEQQEPSEGGERKIQQPRTETEYESEIATSTSGKRKREQKGKGPSMTTTKRAKFAPPPGQKPNVLYIY